MSAPTAALGYAPHTKREPVPFTSYLVHGALALGFLLALSRPIGKQIPDIGVIKHAPLMAFIAAFSLHALGMAAANKGVLYTRGMWRALWPFLLLGVFALFGSLYGRLMLHHQDTFLNIGLYVCTMPLFFWWGRDRHNDDTVIKPVIMVWACTALLAIAGSLAQREHDQPLHESEYIVVPIFLYLYLASTTAWGRFLSIVMLVAASALVGKITGYVIGFTAILYIAIIHIQENAPQKWRWIIYTGAVIGLALAVGAATLLYFYFRSHMPSGSPRVRLHQYAAVYQEIKESPFWGKAYTGNSGVTLIEGGRILYIPTHSDVLDLLRAGGGIALGLWLIGIIKSMVIFATCKAQGGRSAFMRTMLFYTPATAFSYGFNPLLLQPVKAFIIWGILALGLAVATDPRRGQHADASGPV